MPQSGVFHLAGWPASLSLDPLRPYYDRARQVLAAAPHPNARGLAKVQALDRRAREIGTEAFPLDIAVNFTVTGPIRTVPSRSRVPTAVTASPVAMLARKTRWR